jgi:endonuclease/exonuclease/phosphatase family metal-dependent hydrolase
VRIITWNLLNLGRSKDDQEMGYIANIISKGNGDVVALQEVIASDAGPNAVARLDEDLDYTGTRWEYIVSEPTTGQGSERYAYLWKPSRMRLVGQPWLEASLADPLDREPFMARFEDVRTGRQMLLASFHAVPRAKRPVDENVLLDQLHRRYPDDNLLVMGDFNLAQDHQAFDGLKAFGYRPVLVDQRTSIRMQRKDGEHLANEYDNIFYETGPLRAASGGVIDFTSDFNTLKLARTISDHLPVYMDVLWN